MDDYLSDDEKLELIRNWWRENGTFVISGLVIGVLILVGWNRWQDYSEERAGQGSAVYEALLAATALADRDEALLQGQKLQDEFSDTPYASLGSLVLAKLHLDANEAEEAVAHLARAEQLSDDVELRHIARLRQARVRLYQQQYDAALALLETPEAGQFAPYYHEVRGDVLLAQGDPQGAREAYSEAIDSTTGVVGDTQLLRLKLNDLGGDDEVEPEPIEEPASEGDPTGEADASDGEPAS